MRKIYLIRHGLPHFPGGGPYCIGWADFPLDPKGREDILALAGRMKSEELTVFSSPLKRAYDTARAFCDSPIVMDEFREMHAGDWDGLSFAEIKERWPELYAARATNAELPLPNSEDWQEGQRRFIQGVEKALSQCEGHIAIVAHTTVILAYICHIMQDEGYKDYKWRPDYCGWYTLEQDEKGLHCRFPWEKAE